jgi:hypothetical protein
MVSPSLSFSSLLVSLSCSIIELVTGEALPDRGDEYQALRNEIIPHLENVPDGVNELLVRMLKVQHPHSQLNITTATTTVLQVVPVVLASMHNPAPSLTFSLLLS